MTKRVFISDIHMTLGRSLVKDNLNPAKAHEYDWFDLDEAAQFRIFLSKLPDDIDEVILLGDIMDDWLYPHDEEAPSYDEIASAKHIKPILEAIRDCAKKKQVTYVVGNHDMSIMDKKDKATIHFKNTWFPGVDFIDVYEKDGIYAEHGHQYLMWNAIDPDHSLPIGYYITRLLASIHAYTTGVTCTIPDLVGALLKHNFDPKSARDPFVNDPLTFLEEQLDLVEEEHRVNENTTIPKLGKNGIPLKLKDVRKTYSNLSARWKKNHGGLGPLKSVKYELDGLNEVARELVFNSNRKVVVFGHTHKEEICLIEPAAQIPEHREYWGIYANCGSWCEYNMTNPRPYSLVVTESDRDKHTVALMHWDWKKREAIEHRKCHFPPEG
jgi:UDP-2,3-diacylglucosamine pyrophosphatase LpxH